MPRETTIRVEVAASGRVAEYLCKRFPITIGRHADNDVRIAETFVSSFHAQVSETRGRLCVVDLDSTNGVEVELAPGAPRRRVPTQTPHDLEACGLEFFIGDCRISVHKGEQGLGKAPAMQSLPALSSLGLPPEFDAHHLQSVDAHSMCLPAPSQAPFKPPEAPRALVTHELNLSPERAALQGLRELGRSLAPGLTLETAGDVARLISRLHASVEVLCRGFVQLQATHASFSAKMNVGPNPRAVAGGRSLRNLTSPREVAERLLDWRPAAEAVSAEVQACLADVDVHQVALLDGIMQGVASLLAELAPERIEAEAGQGGVIGGLIPLRKHRVLWEAYLERHAELSQGDTALAHVFGTAFRQAYVEYQGRAAGQRSLGLGFG